MFKENRELTRIYYVRLLDFILDKINKDGNEVLVEWFHLGEDDDMREIGEDLEEALSFQFNFFAIEEV